MKHAKVNNLGTVTYEQVLSILIVIYYLTGGNNSMSRFCKFGKLHVTKGNVDKIIRHTTDSFQGAKEVS